MNAKRKKSQILLFIFSFTFSSNIFSQTVPSEVYRVANYNDISNLTVVDNSIILTDIGGRYLVKNTGTHTDYTSIETLNNKFAILQTRDGGYYAEDFGANGTDVVDDSYAIQTCIDASISNRVGRVNFGPGNFYIEKGVIVAGPKDVSGNYTPVGLTISGNIPSYDIGGSGNTTFRITDANYNDADFGIAVQYGRNCLIENINFIGPGDIFGLSIKEWIEFEDQDYQNKGLRTNRYSPGSAIVIDPFDKKIVGSSNKYSLHDADGRYTHNTNNGTSMLLIKGCSFRNFYTAIANNPSLGIGNGDNIRAEQCNVQKCHTFWAAGQIESRSNSIDNVYCTFVNTFVDCSSIGKANQMGIPPVVTNCNVAGFVKELVHIEDGGFSPMRISNTYVESLFSLGYCATDISFDQCHFSFIIPKSSQDIFQSPYQLYARSGSFNNCEIRYFSNSSYKKPFAFLTNHLTVSGGHLEGGVIITSQSGKLMNSVVYNSVSYNNDNKFRLGDKNIRAGLSMFDATNTPLLGGQSFSNEGYGVRTIFENRSNLYNREKISEQVDIVVNNTTKKASFYSSTPEIFKVGDNIVTWTTTSNPIDARVIDMNQPLITNGVLGFVSAIDGDSIRLDGVPYGLKSSKKNLLIVSYPIFLTPVWGDITAGSNLISNIDIEINLHSNINLLKVGTRIYNPALPVGTYITNVDDATNTITINTNAISTATHSYFYNAKVTQEVQIPSNISWPLVSKLVVIPGCKLFLDQPNLSVYGYITLEGGRMNSLPAPPPQFGAMTW